MQLIIPDCCLGEFCPGIHAEGHHKKDDGTYYSSDDAEGKAYHYHNTDGSVFYRYPDGSEYHRRKNGHTRIRPPVDPSEEVEGADPATVTGSTSPGPSGASVDRVWRPWYDWPPQLNLSVGTNGASVTIRDGSGSTITFEPVGAGTGLGCSPAPVRDHGKGPEMTHDDVKCLFCGMVTEERIELDLINKGY